MYPSRTFLTREDLDLYAGHTFEVIVQQAYARFCRRWGLSAAREWSRWEGKDRNRESVEIDAVARLGDGRLLAGEVKWSSRPLGARLHTDLLSKLARLAASGQGWTRDIEDAVLLYVSAAGFTPEFEALADSDSRIRLFSLRDLYADGASGLP